MLGAGWSKKEIDPGVLMNIGIITTWFDRGAAFVSKAYMDVLSREHHVFIYARGGEHYAIGDPRWDLENVTWGTPVPEKPYMYIDWQEFSAWLQTKQIDLLVFNEQQDWDIILRLVKLKIPIGAYIDYYTSETVEFYRLYDFLLCNTRLHYSVFKDHPQAFYIPWGTDTRVFHPEEEVKPKESLTFFHSCGVSPDRKGTDLLVKAFKQVSGGIRLVIHSQLPLKDRFSDLVREINEDKRITLLEQVAAPPGLYHLGDVYVYPTILDGIGLTISEALACGLPVITTNAAPMNEFIIDGENGKLVDVAYKERRSDDYYWEQSFCELESLKKCLEFYFHNAGSINEYRQKARRYALEHLDWSKNATPLNSMISKVRLIHAGCDRKLVQRVTEYEKKRMRGRAYPQSEWIEKTKQLIRKSFMYPWYRSIKRLFNLR
jgi:1,2-diacylglycerol 3-alpha-glucosyltransferase